MIPEKNRELSPAQIQGLQRLAAAEEFKILIDLASQVLDEIRHEYIDEGLSPSAEQEGIASARTKGQVQGILKFFNRLNLETNKDVKGNIREE